MKEIWKASADPGNWHQPRSALLPWWWFLWIVSCIVANAMFRYTLKAEELDELINASGISIASDALDIPLDLVLIAIIDSHGPVRATLELAAGSTARLNIRTGDKVQQRIFGNAP